MAKVGDKYIIEIDGTFAKTTNHGCEKLYRIKGFKSLVFDENGLDKLEKYNEDTSDVIELMKKEYQRGLDDAWECVKKIMRMGSAKQEDIFCCHGDLEILEKLLPSEAIAKIKAYEEQKKAEEVKVGTRVRTIKDKDSAGTTLFPVGTIGVVKEIDGSIDLPYLISVDNDTFYYSKDMFEVIGDDEVKVGDEVYYLDENYKSVVTSVSEDTAVMITQNGKWAVNYVKKLHRTGRHFDTIEEVLKQLQEGEHE